MPINLQLYLKSYIFRSCDSWHEIGRCEAINQLNNFVELVDPKKSGNSLGKINDACGVLSRALAPKSSMNPRSNKQNQKFSESTSEEDYKTSMVIMLISHSFGLDNDQEADNQHSDLPHCSVTFPIRVGKEICSTGRISPTILFFLDDNW